MSALPQPFAPMGLFNQFINWCEVPDDNPAKKPKKVPCNQNRQPIDPHNAANWLTAEQAYSTGLPVGFVLTAADPFFCLDIDYARDNSGNWSPLSTQLCQMFAGGAVEVSTSGNGLHIFGTGAHVLPDGHRCKNMALGIELYTKERFIALGGLGGEVGSAATDLSSVLPHFMAHYLPDTGSGDMSQGWTNAPVPEWNGPADDNQLIEMMLTAQGGARGVFGNKATIRDLWYKNEAVLAQSYPHPDGTAPFDHSSADAALLAHLAFWTGKDCARMDRLFRQSELCRDKWETRDDYRHRSIVGAARNTTNVYSKGTKPEKPLPPAEPVQPSVVMASGEQRSGYQYLAIEQQKQHFSGCVYVRSSHRVFTPDGDLLKPEQFKASYGGYVFQLDPTGDKTTRNAYEVFTESQAYHFPKAHRTCFRPETGSGNLIDDNGQILINTYVPCNVPSEPGDVSPFVDFLQRLIPDQRDRAILLAYMAAVVQYKGVKFQWAPLLQGCEGNGKTFIIHALVAAIGERFTHLPNAGDLAGNGGKFTAWLEGKLFIGVEEIYVAERREAEDALKPLITNSRVEIQGKGADQATGDNRANFVLTSNHRDAIAKRKNDRRYCIFYTGQQQVEDLARDGMAGQYFPNLYTWARSGGFKFITHYLQTYQIPDEINPATHCHRAPETSSTNVAIAGSIGTAEQDILEAVEEGRIGFCGGFISSIWLDREMSNRKIKKIPQNKRKEALANIGYVPHPALPEGRVNNKIGIDNGKPRLYVKADHPAAQINRGALVTEYYVKAQESAAVDNSHAVKVFNQ